ncbi:kinase-like protein [Gigaspora margarita]|uniref:non-specific serine/threonine protein kinase n=3 Tax=Gigaspora margarita TaxID=4874 RepID=A0A8H4B100_GIGMA|nr:kinase-like protein [Gigaspora margarita]
MGEAEALQKELNYVLKKFPIFDGILQVVDRVGVGTFGAVYKARNLRYEGNENTDSAYGSRSPSPTVANAGEKRGIKRKFMDEEYFKNIEYVAIKKIVINYSIGRIAEEISILRELRGYSNIIQLLSAHRHEDEVILITPHFEHDRFRSFYQKMTIDDIKSYFRSLFEALRDVHSHNIVHRDVKPGNFLYNMKEKKGILVDFGLAERLGASNSYLNRIYDVPNVGAVQVINRFPSVVGQISIEPSQSNKPAVKRIRTLTASKKLTKQQMMDELAKRGFIDMDPKGYENKPGWKANRAGTRGFRAPEVLFRVDNQTCAIDIWSAGVILITILSHHYPFFKSTDDADAFYELGILFGKRLMHDLATEHERYYRTDIPLIYDPGLQFDKLLHTMRRDLFPKDDEQLLNEVYNAIDLLKRCLEPYPSRRITAVEALKHPFLLS